MRMELERLARQRARSHLEEAEQLRPGRRALALRRASRLEQRAEHRMVEAWRRAAEVRGGVEAAG
jgi:hypothetical protein